MPKGGVTSEERVLFGKYRLCETLGSGRSGTVYLAWHMELEEYRAVKIVPKTIAGYDTFRKEALFLKTLRHPGIPLVYDLEEDETYSYLIEEYLKGESLYAMVKRLGGLPVKTAALFGIQICRLIQFMNSAENPILYLDLQPKNLLVNEGSVRLIDFDHAQYASDAGTLKERYGTIGFAAPEQRTGEALDCRTDVYAIGALLSFMLSGVPPGETSGCANFCQNRQMERLIRGCMAREKVNRYQSAGEVERALRELPELISKEQAIESLTVVFAGAKPGIGTTHAALGISNFLTRNGCPALYQEAYDTDAARVLIRTAGLTADSSGVYHFGCSHIRPYYGEAVKLPYLYFPIIIKDTGCRWQTGGVLPEADFLVLVCGGKWWENDSALLAARSLKQRGKLILLFNHISGGIRLKLPADLEKVPRLFLPFFPNPFKANREADACFGEIMLAGTGEERWKRKKKRLERFRLKAD